MHSTVQVALCSAIFSAARRYGLIATLFASVGCSSPPALVEPRPPQVVPTPSSTDTTQPPPAATDTAESSSTSKTQPVVEAVPEPPTTFETCTQKLLDHYEVVGGQSEKKLVVACREGDGAACLAMVDANYSITAGSESDACRSVVLRTACERHDGRSCLLVGLLSEAPASALDHACKSGLAVGCALQKKAGCVSAGCQRDLRLLARNGSGKHAELFAPLLRTACRRDPLACALLANLYAQVDDALVKTKALCSGRLRKRCEELLALRSTYEVLLARAERRILIALCESGHGDACTWLALTAPEIGAAGKPMAELLESGCERGSFVACVLRSNGAQACGQQPQDCRTFVDGVLGKDYHSFRWSIGERLTQADTLRRLILEPNCARGHTVSCRALVYGRQHMDEARKRQLLERACPQRDPDGDGCAMLADLMQAAGEPAAAVRKLRVRACTQLNAMSACLTLGMEEMGSDDERQGLAWLDKACTLRSRTACGGLAAHYRETNPAKADAYGQKERSIPLH